MYALPTYVGDRGHPDLTGGPYYLLVQIRNALYSPIQWEAVTNSKLLVFVFPKAAMSLGKLLPWKMLSVMCVAEQGLFTNCIFFFFMCYFFI